MQGNGRDDSTSSKPEASRDLAQVADENSARRARMAALCDAAARGAAVLMQGYRKRETLEVSLKGPVDLVTVYDRASEAVLLEVLGKAFPQCTLIAEESSGSAEEPTTPTVKDKNASFDGPRIYIDPLDGTTNYAHGHPVFAVSIGWVENGRVECGVVYAPALNLLYTGDRVLGATRNDEPCAVSKTDAIESSLLATGFPYDKRTSDDDNLRAFGALEKRARGVRRCGSAALDLCFVADGTYDGYWEKKLKPWDIAAGLAMVHAAGGLVTTLDGTRDANEHFHLLGGAVIATNGVLHARLLEALAQVGPPAFGA